jgi:hypothetical protein
VDLFDLLLLGAGCFMLFRGYQYLINQDEAWRLYEERHQRMGQEPKSLQRDAEWTRSANIQGIVYTLIGAVGVGAAIFT